ncbi:MAG: hypothetical protein J5I93_29570 [Pirellulaceae bacterium]|nr:hypothetical protein [Pirellulaceae bacterium]
MPGRHPSGDGTGAGILQRFGHACLDLIHVDIHHARQQSLFIDDFPAAEPLLQKMAGPVHLSVRKSRDRLLAAGQKPAQIAQPLPSIRQLVGIAQQ